MNQLSVGQSAPEFTLPDAGNQHVSLADFRGSKTVVYFYPKASTPGCTTEACDFRDNINSLKSAGYRVVGISPDQTADLTKFADEQNLNFPLLSDTDHVVAEAWGAWGAVTFNDKTFDSVIRSTFVLDEDGTIALTKYGVSPQGHVAELRRDLGIDQN